MTSRPAPRPRRPDQTTPAHVAHRPRWTCRACAAPWPCGPAKLALLHEYAHDRITLALYLSALMHDAMDDTWLTGHRPDPVNLHTRFLGWLSRRRSADR